MTTQASEELAVILLVNTALLQTDVEEKSICISERR